MEIGQAPSWSGQQQQQQQRPAADTEQASVLLVDLVWTILTLGIFLGAAYLIKRTRDVCLYIASAGPVGKCKPHHHHDQLVLESSSNSVVGGSRSTGRLGLVGAGAAAASLESSSWSSVGSNLSSFWGTAGLEIIRLSKSTKTAASTSIVGQSRLPAIASLTFHELSPCPSISSLTVTPSPSGAHHRNHHGPGGASSRHGSGSACAGQNSKRSHSDQVSAIDYGGSEELALSFPPGSNKHEDITGAAGAAVAGSGRYGGAGIKKFRPPASRQLQVQAQNVQTGELMHHAIHGFEEKIHSDLHSTSTNSENVKGRGQAGSRIGDGREKIEADEVDQQQQMQTHPATATATAAASSNPTEGGRGSSRQAGAAAAAAAGASDVQAEVVASELCTSPSHLPADTGTCEGDPEDYDTIDFSRITQLPFSPDYDHFHFSDLEDDEYGNNMIVLEIGTGGDRLQAMWS
ncbi:hypothetical protein MPTK1_1g08060 [Marchantia polymorpha subsp. ruderalis]|uniref:Uncharacterized protein n=2 Tax=Marchantia polymorpha TaxID=3197 RepID=A0AAF6AMT7_MARPO|nr:hypothetical protein MARPO_0036s0050 [Marchantia polymorpha]BBM97757.1 hypothetical protein Mp_1g08060 [Marchantia polymorpha subsp. ruderalis]|eukprot:PTQ41060.1 hypothetical protein MARPO_0036s0050 [Marchantia polymorpha]